MTLAAEVRDVRKSFGQGRVQTDALRGVSLKLHCSEVTLLMGPSGSGKSTLAAILGGLLKPTSGSVVALGTNLNTLSARGLDRFRLKHCGFVFQGANLFPSLTAMEQIVFALQFRNIAAKHATSMAMRALEEVDMADKAQLKPGQMSGGESQRVVIARTLAMEPSLIIADEPTSALDGANGQLVAELLHRAAKVHNTMVFCVTHDERLCPHADVIVQIVDGLLTDNKPLAYSKSLSA